MARQEEPQNWQATFLEHLLSARGVIVVLSSKARESHQTEGRGMWRERPAIAYIQDDEPSRVIKIDRSGTDEPSDELMGKIIKWAQEVLLLPPVNRHHMTEEVATSFNIKQNNDPRERKTPFRHWCEIVRLNLYDEQWHCCRCGLKGSNYNGRCESPPDQCPRCAYNGEDAHLNPAGEALVDLSRDDTWRQAGARNLEKTYSELMARLEGLPEDMQLMRLKERLKKKIESLRVGHNPSGENPFLKRAEVSLETPKDEKAVVRQMWGVISAAVWEKSQRSTEQHIESLEELLANITVFEEKGTAPSGIMDYVHRFFLEVMKRFT